MKEESAIKQDKGIPQTINIPLAHAQMYGINEAIYLGMLGIISGYKMDDFTHLNYPLLLEALNLNYTEQARLVKGLEFRGIIETKTVRENSKNKKVFRINYRKLEEDADMHLEYRRK